MGVLGGKATLETSDKNRILRWFLPVVLDGNRVLQKNIDTHQSLKFLDVSVNDCSSNGVLSQKDAMARFHVLTSDGKLLSGAKAFVEVWQGLPRWRLLAKVFSFPGLTALLELVYRIFLLLRPLAVSMFFIAQRLRSNRAKYR